jgi:hypothetical protein
VTLRIVNDFSILLAFFCPFRARGANPPNGKPAPDDFDVLANPFIRISSDFLRLGMRIRLERHGLRSQHGDANGCCTRQWPYDRPSFTRREPLRLQIATNSSDRIVTRTLITDVQSVGTIIPSHLCHNTIRKCSRDESNGAPSKN